VRPRMIVLIFARRCESSPCCANHDVRQAGGR
jgi:hypothetical protein